MVKKIIGVIVLVILVFALGIFLENKIKENLNKIDFNKLAIVEVNPSTLVSSGEAREKAVVKRVIDGDTIELSDGRKVRYIGVDAPEMTDKRTTVLCLAKMARAENQGLVEGQTVELEKDISNMDKYDRLLRYVWVNNTMVNLTLVKSGYAKIATYPPDVKYKTIFWEAQKSATPITCKDF